MHPAALDEADLLAQCQRRTARGSGPGGQHRNKTDSAVHLTHTPTGIEGQASERRSQHENQRVALRRLRVNLALDVRESAANAPSELWQSRCRGGRLSINPKHADFPTLLAEALDQIAAFEDDVSAAAARLGCSTSQLTKLLRHEPKALATVNQARQQRGLHALK